MKRNKPVKNGDLLYKTACAVFYLMALAVVWNAVAASDYRWLSENSRKIWAMAGLGLYLVILLERQRRKKEE